MLRITKWLKRDDLPFLLAEQVRMTQAGLCSMVKEDAGHHLLALFREVKTAELDIPEFKAYVQAQLHQGLGKSGVKKGVKPLTNEKRVFIL